MDARHRAQMLIIDGIMIRERVRVHTYLYTPYAQYFSTVRVKTASETNPKAEFWLFCGEGLPAAHLQQLLELGRRHPLEGPRPRGAFVNDVKPRLEGRRRDPQRHRLIAPDAAGETPQDAAALQR